MEYDTIQILYRYPEPIPVENKIEKPLVPKKVTMPINNVRFMNPT